MENNQHKRKNRHLGMTYRRNKCDANDSKKVKLDQTSVRSKFEILLPHIKKPLLHFNVRNSTTTKIELEKKLKQRPFTSNDRKIAPKTWSNGENKATNNTNKLHTTLTKGDELRKTASEINTNIKIRPTHSIEKRGSFFRESNNEEMKIKLSNYNDEEPSTSLSLERALELIDYVDKKPKLDKNDKNLINFWVSEIKENGGIRLGKILKTDMRISLGPKKNVFHCLFCDVEGSKQETIINHNLSCHIIGERGSYLCEECNTFYKIERTFAKHYHEMHSPISAQGQLAKFNVFVLTNNKLRHIPSNELTHKNDIYQIYVLLWRNKNSKKLENISISMTKSPIMTAAKMLLNSYKLRKIEEKKYNDFNAKLEKIKIPTSEEPSNLQFNEEIDIFDLEDSDKDDKNSDGNSNNNLLIKRKICIAADLLDNYTCDVNEAFSLGILSQSRLLSQRIKQVVRNYTKAKCALNRIDLNMLKYGINEIKSLINANINKFPEKTQSIINEWNVFFEENKLQTN